MDPNTWHSGHVTLAKKKHALCALQETIRYCRTPEALTHSTSRLMACFSSDPQVIQQCCDLLALLMTKDGFTVGLAGDALGRFLRYLPLFFMCDGNGGAKERMVAGLAKLIQRFTKIINANDQVVAEFPFGTLLNLNQMIFNGSLNGSRLLVDLILQTTQLASSLPNRSDHMVSKDMKKMIATSYSWLRNRTSSYTDVLDLSRFADCLLETYLGVKPMAKQYWIELQLELIYGTIFDRLLPDNRPVIVEFLLTVLYGFLRRELDLDVKLAILRVLLQRGEGLRGTLTMFYLKTAGSGDLQFSRFKFQGLKSELDKIVQDVDWSDLISGRYRICQLPVAKLTKANLWIIMLVQYFEAELAEDRMGPEETLDYVTNLGTLVSVCFLKQFQLPAFLIKFVLESVAKCHNHTLYKNNELVYNNQLRQLVPSTNFKAVFGLLPTSIPRLRWFHQQAIFPYKAEFQRHQRFEALQERLLPEYLLTPQILTFFPEAYLMKTLLSRDIDLMVLTNACLILSRVQLSETHLVKLVTMKLTRKNRGLRWPHYLRALYGSLAALTPESRTELVGFIAMKLSNSSAVSEPECLVLLVDSLVRIFATNPNLKVPDDWQLRLRDISDGFER
ncbi:hypothetical protein pipiens_008514 [Culex pipiens pipiens]|uniref:Uncharacterized protein n=1 Tax=Culex pipiens pipiens TaxID=38569 RepID=A0ABD1DH78_CULPP